MMDDQLRADLIEFYDQQAEERDKRDIQDWKTEERAAFLDLLKAEQKRSLLEIGAGTGRDSRVFQENGFQVTCIDLSPQMVRLCQQKGLNGRVMDMVNLEFADNSFDAVYSLNSMLHLRKVELPIVLQNVRRILKTNGLFFLGMYGGLDFEGVRENDPYTPKRFFSFHSDEKLEQTVAKSFKLLSFRRISIGDEKIHFQSLILRKSAP